MIARKMNDRQTRDTRHETRDTRHEKVGTRPLRAAEQAVEWSCGERELRTTAIDGVKRPEADVSDTKAGSGSNGTDSARNQ